MLNYPMKYAQHEYERRFLLEALPPDLKIDDFAQKITDHYLVDTQMRLRRMQTAVSTQYKLGKKITTPDNNPLVRIMSNIYLTEAEYHLFATLPAIPLQKTRYTYHYNNLRYSIDVFDEHNLILCEIEQPTLAQLTALEIPSFAVKDVTTEEQYSGYRLAKKGSN